MSLTLIPFAAFTACVLGMLYLIGKMSRVLEHRHPSAWRELSSNTMFTPNAVRRFAMKKREEALNDPELSLIAGRIRKLQVVTFGIWLICAAAILAARAQ